MAEFLALTVPFFTVGFLTWLFLFFGDRRRVAAHETVRMAMERGQELSPDLIDKLSLVSDPRTTDLRRGTILVGLAIAIATFGQVMAGVEPDLPRIMLGVSVFPGILGLAYLALSRLGHGRKTD